MKFPAVLLFASIFMCAHAAHAADSPPVPFTGLDISGVYACTGTDAHDGKFAYVMTVTLDRRYSHGNFGAFKAQMAGEHERYTGSIVSNGEQMALDFANGDASKKDFGVALGTISRLPNGQYKLAKFYYEAQYLGGSNGFEACTLK